MPFAVAPRCAERLTIGEANLQEAVGAVLAPLPLCGGVDAAFVADVIEGSMLVALPFGIRIGGAGSP